MAKLKVYRTPIGFHDAYVAATSQKAALKAWGSDADLFARGIAEVVTDEALSAEPLASPGTVIRKLRGTVDEQMAAKIPDRPSPRPRDKEDEGPAPRKRASKKPIAVAPPPPPPRPPPQPRPDRASLDAAEKAVEDAQVRHDQEDRDLRKRQEALDEERRRLDQAHDKEHDRLAEDEDRARRAALSDQCGSG